MVYQTKITTSALETQKLGQELANTVKQGGVLALYGELGSGKTTFTQGLARGLEIERRIVSPTFIFIRYYPLASLRVKRSHSVIASEAKQSQPEIAAAACGGLAMTTKRTDISREIFYHIDLYRIQSLNEAKALGLEEIIEDPSNIVVIEWPEKIKAILPQKRIDIYFEYVKDNSRKITMLEQ